MRFQDVVRFEFRRFGGDLTRFRQAFAALAPARPQPVSRETYIVTRLNTEANVKIRSHRLQVKGLLGRLHGLERWMPVLDVAFPVESREIENTMAPALGLDIELFGAAVLSETELLDLVRTQPALASIVVEKTRILFEVGGCEAEFSELKIAEGLLQTVAVEAEDAEAARTLLGKVGLDAMHNESYPSFLQARLFPPGL